MVNPNYDLLTEIEKISDDLIFFRSLCAAAERNFSFPAWYGTAKKVISNLEERAREIVSAPMGAELCLI